MDFRHFPDPPTPKNSLRNLITPPLTGSQFNGCIIIHFDLYVVDKLLHKHEVYPTPQLPKQTTLPVPPKKK